MWWSPDFWTINSSLSSLLDSFSSSSNLTLKDASRPGCPSQQKCWKVRFYSPKDWHQSWLLFLIIIHTACAKHAICSQRVLTKAASLENTVSKWVNKKLNLQEISWFKATFLQTHHLACKSMALTRSVTGARPLWQLYLPLWWSPLQPGKANPSQRVILIVAHFCLHPWHLTKEA